MLHARFAAPAPTPEEATVVQLPGRRRSGPPADAVELLPQDHPVLLLLDEVERLRGQLEESEVVIAGLRSEVTTAYARECDLVSVLHRHVLAEQASQERRHWWSAVGRRGRA